VTGYLHALVEDAAREAGCTVAQMVAPQFGRRPSQVDAAKRAAIMAAVDAGYSREQIGRVFNRSKRNVVRVVKLMRSPRYPSFPQALHRRAEGERAV
jgi:DNA-binding LacI/PurR family transcriptional regulator